MPFISFSCHFLWLGLSSTMVNKSGDTGHPSVVPDLRQNAVSFSPWTMILAVGKSDKAFFMLI